MGQRSIEIEILEIARDGRWEKTDELVHEEGIIVRFNAEVHEFHRIPVDLEELGGAGVIENKNQVIYNIVACFLDQMHELGVTENIVNIALAKAGEAQASKVTQINLVIGEMSGFVPDCIQFYFDFLSKDTIAQGAVLHLESVPAQLRCRNCSAIFHPQDTLWSCPKCQGQSVEIFKGRELYIESMEVE